MAKQVAPIPGDTVELVAGLDAGFAGIVNQVDAYSAVVDFAADGEDARRVPIYDLKVTHRHGKRLK